MNLIIPEPGDVDFILKSENDPDNYQYIGHWNRETHLNALNDPNFRYFIFVKNKKRIGYCILIGLENPENSINLKRLVINEKGRGYGKEALRVLLAYVFEERGIKRFWLDVRTFNKRAEALYRKMDFIYEGTLRQASKLVNCYFDLHIFSMLDDEYKTD